MVVTLSNLLYSACSRRLPEAEYSRKSVAANNGLQRMNRALIPRVVEEDKGRQVEISVGF
jgi:hypothetical protein